MNKYEDALNGLIEELPYTSGVIEERIKTLQELIDKETPKKYKIKTDKDGRMIWVCPNCSEILVKFWNEVETISHVPHCWNCGQKLSWLESEE